METFLVILTVVAAAAYSVRIFIKNYRGESNCACGSTCSAGKMNCMQSREDELNNIKINRK